MGDSDQNDEGLSFEGPLGPGEFQRLVARAAEQNGLQIRFERGSNPVLHMHVHYEQQQMEKNMGDKYVDRSTGATGAKAFGSHASAESTGDITQILDTSAAAQLVERFTELQSLLKKVDLPDPAQLRQTQECLVEAIAVAKDPEPRVSKIKKAWEKAKGWIATALEAGLFIKETANRVRELLTEIAKCL